jgi:rhamnogalacturonyl hydrolase YesR
MSAMKTMIVAGVAAAWVAATAGAVEPVAGAIFQREAVRNLIHKVNDWQLAHPWARPPWDRNWERATWYTGVMAAYKATGDQHLLDQAMAWGKHHEWAVSEDPPGGNKLFGAQVWLDLYYITRDRALLQPTIAWCAADKSNSPGGKNKRWYGWEPYVDSLYSSPTLVKLYAATGDPKYVAKFHAFWDDLRQTLFDKEDGLFYRDEIALKQKTVSGRKVFWARGNGWAFGALVQVLDNLPADDPRRQEYVELFKTMAASLARRQGADGLWRTNLGDLDQFPGPESSGTAFFVYGMGWGIRQGLLEKATYLPVVQKGWRGLVGCVSPAGVVQYGQGIGDRPAAVEKASTHEYVVGAFLLAASELYRLADAADDSAGLLPPAALKAALSPQEHPLAGTIEAFRKRQPSVTPEATGLTRAAYLQVIAGEVRALRACQDAQGRIVDPVAKCEVHYTTPCYAHAVAALAASGVDRDPALLESGMKAMDAATRAMVEAKKTDTYDFFTYPLMMALPLYGPLAPPDRVAAWRERLQRFDPKKVYYVQDPKGHNWVVVNLAGDYLRAAAGLCAMDSVETRLEGQLGHFTDQGLYIEHGPALPYDHFSRHYLAGILQQGYRGKYFDRYRDLLWRGAWTSLFMMSPAGEAPTGYRSSHHIWNEAQSCVTYEIYAAQYARAGRVAEAGAFKRAAHLSLRCVQRWIRPDGSGCIVKNRYPIEARHGYENYGFHSCYNMLACSMLAQAWQFADDAVEERPAPCEVGGYVLAELAPLHKIFACAAGSYLEYDTYGDQHYNPTGLLRIHVKGGHPQLGPSDGCGEFISGKGNQLAVGPQWQESSGVWRSLAEMTPAAPKVEVLDEKPERASFRVTFKDVRAKGSPAAAGVAVTETVTVAPSGVTVQDEVSGEAVKTVRIGYPMLVCNGAEKTEVHLSGNTLKMRLEGKGVTFEVLEPSGVTLIRSGRELKHRNGMIEPVYAEVPGRTAVYRIQSCQDTDNQGGYR